MKRKKKALFTKEGEEQRKKQFWLETLWGLGAIIVLAAVHLAMQNGWM